MPTVIAIFSRSPADPRIKTLLAPLIPSVDDRRELALAFLDDQLDRCRQMAGVAVRIAVTPPIEGLRISRPQVTSNLILPQRGTSWAERQLHVMDDLAARGFTHVIMLGSDVPDLPRRVIEDAIAALHADPTAVVVGSSPDGGYYLLGARVSAGAVPSLFADVRWSTEHEGADVIAAAERAGRTVVHVDAWRDVDRPEALTELAARLRAVPEAAPKTAAMLTRLGLRG
jgi:hypothetical protein